MRPRINLECADYNCGFCINGPHCQYIHRKKPESLVSAIE